MVEGNTSGRDRERLDNIAEMRFEGYLGAAGRSGPLPTTFTSKIVSNGESSDVTMVLDEGSVKELAASPPPGRERVPVTEANRQGIVDPLTAMLFSAAAASEGLPQEACQHTLPIFDGHHRYDLKLAFKRMHRVDALRWRNLVNGRRAGEPGSELAPWERVLSE